MALSTFIIQSEMSGSIEEILVAQFNFKTHLSMPSFMRQIRQATDGFDRTETFDIIDGFDIADGVFSISLAIVKLDKTCPSGATCERQENET